MKYKNYEKFEKDMVLNDHLAVDRTKLANERTLLAFLRTVITFVVAGITLGNILDGRARIYVVAILFTSAFVFGGYGIYQYIKLAKKLKFD
ncbi:MAG: DUF202 domain-containing protein [Clostridium sp.]